jgi:hypothetical protein
MQIITGQTMQTTIASALCAVAVLSGVSVARAQDDVNSIRYSLADWDPEYVLISKMAPKLIVETGAMRVTPPPANDSEQTKAELDTLRADIALRDAETLARITAENDAENVTDIFLSEGLINPAQTPSVLEFLNYTQHDVLAIILKEKMRYQRARPSQLADDLHPVIDVPKHASYPSGHATQGHFAALVLAAADPDNAEKYMQFGHDIGYRREVAGVHYPSDSKAGRELAQKLFDAVLQDDKAKALLEQAKEEFKGE